MPPTACRASSPSSRAASARRARSARARSPTRLERIETGAGDDADLATIGGWLERVTDGNRCYLAVEERLVVSSILRAFPDEFAEHIEQHGCPRPARRPIPKLLDLADGGATYDESFWRKRPDWTYDTGLTGHRVELAGVPPPHCPSYQVGVAPCTTGEAGWLHRS